jgi:hypothetical protein
MSIDVGPPSCCLRKRRIPLDEDVDSPKPIEKSAVRARGGVKGHNVRYVLALSLIGVISAFILIAFYFGLL